MSVEYPEAEFQRWWWWGKQLKALDPIVVNRAERRMTLVEENLRLVGGVLVMQQNFEPVEDYGWILQVNQRRELK